MILRGNRARSKTNLPEFIPRRCTVSIKIKLEAIILIGSMLLSAEAAYAAWYDADWEYRKKITIQSSEVAANQSDPAVLIHTTDPDWRDTANGGRVAQSDGGDILFTSSDGITKLYHEIEMYTPSTGEIVAWVNVPAVSSSSDTEIYIYYGNAGASDQWDGSGNTWNAGYGIVYHMNASCTDSTSNGRNCTAVIDSPSTDDTYLGHGLGFAGDDAWDQSDLAYWEQQWNARSHEIVFRTGSDVMTRQVLFAEGAGVNGVMLYILNGSLYARWWSESQGWDGDHLSANISADTPYHVILSYDYPGGDYELFVNGSSAGSGSTSVFINEHSGNGGMAYTGPNSKDFHDLTSTQGHYFTGSIYEFRVRDSGTDSGYALTSYNNISSPSTFYSIGSEESVSIRYWVNGSGSWSDDGNHWATASGGVPSAGNKPSADDIAVFDANSGGGTCTLDESISIDSLDMQTGNTTFVTSDNNNVTVAGDFTVAGGAFSGTSAIISVGGDWDSSAGSWYCGGSTVVLTGTGSLAQQTTSWPWLRGFNNLVLAASGQTTTLASNQVWIRKLTVGSGTFTDGPDSSTVFLQGVGDVFVDGGATMSVQNFYYRANNYTQNIVGRDYSDIGTLGLYGVGGSSGSNVYDMQGNVTANSIRVWLNNNSGDARNSVLNTNNYSITSNSLYLGRYGDTNDHGVLNAGSSTLDINGSVTVYASDLNGANEINAGSSNWNVSGNWTNEDTFIAGSSTVYIDGSGGQAISSGGSIFNTLIISNSSGAGVTFTDTLTANTFVNTTSGSSLKFSSTGPHTVNNVLTLAGGTGSGMITLGPETPSTAWDISPPAGTTVSGVNVIYSQSNTPITANNSNDGGNNTNWNFSNVTRYWVAGSAGNWSDPANWSDTSGGSGGYSVPGSGDTAVFDASGPGDCALDIAPSISVLTVSGYSGTISTGAQDLSVFTLTLSGGTLSLGSQTTTVSGDLTISGGVLSAGSGDMDTGNVAIVSGSFTAPGSGRSFTVSGDWTYTGGTFTANGGTITLDGNNQTITGSNTFNNLSKTSSAADTLSFAAGSSQTILGTVLFAGAPANLLLLQSTVNGSKWDITLTGGSQSASYLDVSDSDANTNSVTCINCRDSGNNNGNWLFDPFGIVFDSATNRPIEGAEISLWYDTGGGNWVLAVPGTHIDAADNNPQTTGADGAYSFLTVPGDFRITITSAGYNYPSVKTSFPAGRVICPGDPACSGQPGSRGEVFTVSGPAIQMDHPLDGGADLIRITKKANKKEATVGDIITYTVKIESQAETDLTGVRITDMIPAGFKYITNRTILDNQAISDPQGRRPVIFDIGTLTTGQTRTLKYQLIIGSGVTLGTYENRAWANYSDGTLISNTAHEEVEIVNDPLFDMGTVIGRVFLDTNEDGTQNSSPSADKGTKTTDDTEPGIADVRIVTEEGTVITTDKDGKYHIAGMPPGRHVLRIDERTLPEGARLTTDKAVIIDMTPGMLHKVNFGVGKTEVRRQKSETKDIGSRHADKAHTNSDGLQTVYTSITSLFDDFLFVGLADMKTGHTEASGHIEPVEDDDKFNDGFWSEGRLAYYLKGKIKGKYILTSSLDTNRDNKDLFRNLDPDRYYPVYGDSSTANYDAADTQGMLYAAVEWDRSKVMWGNYPTEITDTELARFSRTLYGGKLHYESVSVTEAGRPDTKIIVFQAEARQKAAHNEFPGTGGTLYYLKHRPLIHGSEKVAIEVRDKNTGLAVAKIDQKEGEDYEIDYENARIMFYEPVSRIAESASIISTGLLNGNTLYVVVDYEYEVNEADYSDWSYGGRVDQSIKQAISALHIPDPGFIRDMRLGGTYIKESQDSGDYELTGVDTSLYIGEHTVMTAEYAESASQGMMNFISTDGGLNFTEIPAAAAEKGRAYSLRAKTRLSDIISLDGYYVKRDKGFSDSGSVSRAGKRSAGAQIGVEITERTFFTISHDIQKLIDSGNTLSAAQVGALQTDTTTARMTHGMDKLGLTGEYRHIEVKQRSSISSETNEEGDTAALRADYEVNNDLGVFLGQQVTLSGDDNYQTTAGVTARPFSRLHVNVKETIGTKGNAASIGATVRIDEETDIHSSFSVSNSRSSGRKTSISTGSRKKLSDSIDVTTGTHNSRSDTEQSSTDVLGISGKPDERWKVSGSYEKGVVQSIPGGESKRNAGSIWAAYENEDLLKVSGRIELRSDKGEENKRQYLLYGAVRWKANKDTTLFGKINISESRNTTSDTTEARYKELVFGSAYRPVDFDRLNLVARYTYLEDLKAAGQSDVFGIEQSRSHVMAAEAVYDLTDTWQIAEKFAIRLSDEQVAGFDFTETQTWLWINRLGYNLYQNWQVGAEYRILRQKQADDMKQGALVEVARYFGKNIQVGAGYNFTAFNDDLTYLDYTAHGPFIRLTAKIID